MKRIILFGLIISAFSLVAIGQVAIPRESQPQTITQSIGDTTVTISYHRPNVKGRKIWGGLVPYNEVWRAGANEATTIEFSRDVNINGNALPAGKYSLHMIPTESEWTVIFNKTWEQWGSYSYNEKEDALRVNVRPAAADHFETMVYGIGDVTASSARVFLRWERLIVPFTLDIGDIHGRVLTPIREAIKERKEDDVRALNQGANYIMTFRLADNYAEALEWINASIAVREQYGNLATKARLLRLQGKTSEAVTTGEKALVVGRSSTPPANPNAMAGLEGEIAEWKKGD
jgi:hypothetical protein